MLIRGGRTYAADDGSGGSGGGGGGGAPGPDGGAGGGGTWYAGKVDQETVGHWQNRGWDVSDPVKVSTAVTKAWRDAEAATQALHGVPADRILKMPAPGDEAALRAFHQRLGAPADKTGYDFSGVKYPDGSAVADTFTAPLAETFHKLGVSKDAAAEITRSMVNWVDSQDKAESAETTAKVQAEQQALKNNWGQNFDNNRFVARTAAGKLGVTPAELDALDGQIGHARVMEMFRQIGEQMGEAKFTGGGPGGGPQPMTQEQAVARIADLKRDSAWVTKFLAGDTAARNEMTSLQRMKLGGVDESLRPTKYAR